MTIESTGNLASYGGFTVLIGAIIIIISASFHFTYGVYAGLVLFALGFILYFISLFQFVEYLNKYTASKSRRQK